MSNMIQPEFRSIDGLSIRLAESDPSDTRPVEALLFNPWPETLYAYEPSWKTLASHARFIAIDLPGFGHSERSEALLSPKAMGGFIVRLADALGVNRPHIVGPDIGTSACLFAAAQAPDRFRSVVIGTGGAAVPLALGDPLKEWVEAKDDAPYRRIGGEAIVNAALSTLKHYKPSDAALQDYRSAYAGGRFADTLPYVQAYPRELPDLGELLKAIRTPVLVINGRHDPVVPLVNAEYLVDRLPRSKLAVIDRGHFIWEDGAEEYAAHVTSWWDGGYEKVG